MSETDTGEAGRTDSVETDSEVRPPAEGDQSTGTEGDNSTAGGDIVEGDKIVDVGTQSE